MRTAARSSRAAVTLGALCATVAVMTAAAGAAPSAVDLYVDIGVGSSLQDARPVPNGGSKSVVGLTFWAGPGVEIINPEAASARVRFDLPAGLRWGTDEPDPSEQCTSTPSSGTCQTPLLEPITGRTGVGWAWQIVAERVGSYVLRAELVETSAPDAEPSNDTASVTVVVTDTPSPPPPPGAGGASVGAAKLSPARPKAGSTVVASVRMTAGGSPTRPAGVTCTATAGATKVKGVGRAGNGSATCTYRTPRSAKGKLLRGAVSFTAVGAKYTKRFSVRLG